MRVLRRAYCLPLLILVRRSRHRAAIELDALMQLNCGTGQNPAVPRYNAELEQIPGSASVGPSTLAVLDGLTIRQVRTVVHHRMAGSGRWESCVARVARAVWPGLPWMELNCPDIGPGFVIGHGYGSVIWAQSIGSDCRVSQGVTMGYGRKGTRLPVLGDGVRIHANACIIGARIGDGATVGAGAVVIHDVAAGDVVVGAPARSIRR